MPTMPTSEIGEVFTYPQEMLRTFAFQAVRRVRVVWADRYNWANYFLGSQAAQLYPYFVAEGIPTSSTIVRIAIEPDKTKLTHGAVSEAQAVYTHAIMTLVYQSGGWNANEMFIEEITPFNDSMPAYVGQTYWSSGLPTGQSSINIIIPCQEYKITYPRRTTLPTIVQMPGVINMDAFLCHLIPLYIYPYRGLYMGADIRATYSYDGILNYEVEHTVLIRPFSWNQEWDPLTAAADTMYDENGVAIVKHASFIFTGLL